MAAARGCDEDEDATCIRCECGNLMYQTCYMHTWSCKCGRCYNHWGQELADPCLWGEELDRYAISAGHESLYV